MKRILVKENLNRRTNSLRESLKEGNWPADDLDKRVSSLRKLLREGNNLVVDLNTKIKFIKKSLREGERSTIDLQALKEVQKQFDSFIRQMIEAKVLLAGLEIGGDDAYYENYEKEINETGEIE
jgi:phosphomevalonate kinase